MLDSGSDSFRFKLSGGLIHVWDAEKPVDSNRYSAFYEILDELEKQRADRFRSEQHRIRFVSCRGWLRLLLSAYTGVDPGYVALVNGEFGKPRLKQNAPNTGLVFNVSHSFDRMVFAFGLDCMLGVDIERLRDINRLPALVDRICSETEKKSWQQLPEEQQLRTFYSIWVRKESIIKAQGRGLSLGMQDCVLTGRSLDCPILLPEPCGDVADWTLLDLDCGEDYQGAIAVNGPLQSLVRKALPEGHLCNLYLS